MTQSSTVRKSRLEAQRQRAQSRQRFVRSRKAEQAFARQLRAVAKQVGAIVKGMAPKGVVVDFVALRNTLAKYSELIRPWARAVTQRMIDEVGQRDEQSWSQLGKEMGQSLRAEIRHAPTGVAMRAHMDEAVELITSLPTKAAERVHRLVIEGMSQGTRAADIATEILRTGPVTEARAMLIARTETSRAATSMTMSRALHVGSEGYIWRTAGDSDVRPLHRKLEGKFIRWDDPPLVGSNGEHGHPGEIYNCRCYPEPVIPD